VGEATVTGRWARLRRWARWSTRVVVIAAAGVVAVWAAQRVPWDAPLSVLGYAILTAPLYGFAFWTAHNRGWLIERCDEATDGKDLALSEVDRLREEWRTQGRAIPGPERVRGRPETVELPRVARKAPAGTQRVPPPVPDHHTTPRGIDLAGGARTGGATASGRGRHAAPDTDDRQAGAL
jgi:hypothetical protein